MGRPKLEEKSDTVLELNRKEKVRFCDECKKEYAVIPAQCACGADAKLFNEREVIPDEDVEREEFLVEKNMIYDGRHVNAGTKVRLVKKDRVTRGMIKDKLISPVKV